MPSKIAWTEETWNPIVGCAHCSPGCDSCYAARLAHGRLAHMPRYAGLAIRRYPDEEPRFTGEVRVVESKIGQPLRWRKPRLVFANSMSDLFHPDVSDEVLERIFNVMACADRHTFQVLTKRPQRMAAWMRKLLDCDHGGAPTMSCSWCAPIRNIWLGTSIENDRYAWRADHVRATPAAVRWLSLEPLIGPVPSLDLADIDWVVVGGESGPQPQPMDEGWVRDIRDRCADAQIPLFMKQAGVVLARQWGMSSRNGDALEEMPEDLRVRQYPLPEAA